ncbi:hypothetical protein E2C01_050455 [Portunus trituberculatus]|uniref:Uncharacterized protein n=1 Tax=Portunus trituberculatus TaxID=210409 RepID=A0A5B7GJ08_PORTR|nr:hypothetical protein [Portunus trituberculatus]
MREWRFLQFPYQVMRRRAKEWRVVSAGTKRKILRASQRVETMNSFVLEGVEEEENGGRGCLPGAKIEKVSVHLDTCLEADGTKPIVFFNSEEGMNDLCKVRSEELLRRFKEALAKIKDPSKRRCLWRFAFAS